MIGAEVETVGFLMQTEHYSFHFHRLCRQIRIRISRIRRKSGLAVELNVEYTDGTSETICTDALFRVRAHEISMSNVYGSRRLMVQHIHLNGTPSHMMTVTGIQAQIVAKEQVPQEN